MPNPQNKDIFACVRIYDSIVPETDLEEALEFALERLTLHGFVLQAACDFGNQFLSSAASEVFQIVRYRRLVENPTGQAT